MATEAQLVAEAAQGVAEATEASGGIGALGLNVKIFIAQLVNFTIVMLVMWKWAYKPIIRLLDERQEKVEKSVKDAEEIEARLNRLDSEQEEILRKAKANAQQILDDVREKGEVQRKVMLKKATADVEQVVIGGKAQLVQERESMIREARKELASIALTATRKILGEEIDEKKSLALATDAIKEIT